MIKICDRCCCVEASDNPIVEHLTAEGYFYEYVCSECSLLEINDEDYVTDDTA